MAANAESYQVVVIGGGAAGVFASIHAAQSQAENAVCVLEGSRRFLTKVKVSGGGRCNVTHSCFDPRELVKNYPRGARELLGPFHHFGPEQMIAWLVSHGVELKTEADGRMFPISDESQTIIDCLLDSARRYGAELRKAMIVKSVERRATGGFTVNTNQGSIEAKKLIVATGSAPLGYAVAEQLGHKLVDQMPSLFTFNIDDPRLKGMEGVSFKSALVALKIPNCKKSYEFKGPILITHWGLSGPAILKLSAFAARDLFGSDYRATLTVNFNSDWSKTDAESWLAGSRSKHGKKSVNSIAPDFFTKKHWTHFLLQLSIDPAKRIGELSAKELDGICAGLVESKFQVNGKGVFKEEFVTSGGINLKEVDMRTMQSKVCDDLYFAGEILDVDGITGGFNFQNAWTTGFIAGRSTAD